jgi:selenocysteine lyase/cysteine desulfurase
VEARVAGGYEEGVLALLAALALAAAPSIPDGVLGTYRVQATIRTTDIPFASRLEARGDVVLRAGDVPGAVLVRLASNGKSCELAGKFGKDGAIAFASGQTCAIPLDDPLVAPGRVDATLRAGSGHVGEGRIALDFEVALAGIVHGPAVRLGRTNSLPIGGKAWVQAEGRRDNSRAAAEP